MIYFLFLVYIFKDGIEGCSREDEILAWDFPVKEKSL